MYWDLFGCESNLILASAEPLLSMKKGQMPPLRLREADVSHSRFDSKAECFSTTNLPHILQPATLMSFQKLCITVDLLKRGRNLASPRLNLWRRHFCGFASRPPILTGLW